MRKPKQRKGGREDGEMEEEERRMDWMDGGREKERESANAAHRSHRGNSVLATHTHTQQAASLSLCHAVGRQIDTQRQRERGKTRKREEKEREKQAAN